MEHSFEFPITMTDTFGRERNGATAYVTLGLDWCDYNEDWLIEDITIEGDSKPFKLSKSDPLYAKIEAFARKYQSEECFDIASRSSRQRSRAYREDAYSY